MRTCERKASTRQKAPSGSENHLSEALCMAEVRCDMDETGSPVWSFVHSHQTAGLENQPVGLQRKAVTMPTVATPECHFVVKCRTHE
eukprot:1537494-Amphidinium_carterae.1